MYVMINIRNVISRILNFWSHVRRNDCGGPTVGANKWVIKRGGQQIKVSGTTYCLDAGSSKLSTYTLDQFA